MIQQALMLYSEYLTRSREPSNVDLLVLPCCSLIHAYVLAGDFLKEVANNKQQQHINTMAQQKNYNTKVYHA